MKSIDIINEFRESCMKVDPGVVKTVQYNAAKAQMMMHDIHSRSIACLCECMGMNSENTIAVCENRKPPYSDDIYLDCMRKWKLIDDDGNLLI